MIQKYVENIAVQMGIQLSHISVVDGKEAGCLHVHLLQIVVGEKQGSALVYQADLDALHTDHHCDRLELKIRAALSKLQCE